MTDAETPNAKRIRVLALASGGGHWVQLLRLRPSWAGFDVAYATTNPGCEHDIRNGPDSDLYPSARFYTFPDANRWQKLRLFLQLLAVARIVLRERPDIVISTGASAGYFAIRIGKHLGSRTIWVDSIANSEELSLSGRLAARYADLWLTQWPHLAARDGNQDAAPQYLGAVL